MRHSYHAHHAPPCGAAGSFLVGLNDSPGGFVNGGLSEGPQDVFVGYRYPGEAWTLLPFLGADTKARAHGTLAVLPHGRYGRMLGWASDRWMAQALVFLMSTPFARGQDAAGLTENQRRVLTMPTVHALLDFDNGHMDQPAELVFALGGGPCPWRPLRSSVSPVRCLGWETASQGVICGFATAVSPQVRAVDDAQTLGVPAVGFCFHIPAGGKCMFPLALGWGADVPRTLPEGLAVAADARTLAQRRDEELRASGLDEDVRRQISLATREALARGANEADALLDAWQASQGAKA